MPLTLDQLKSISKPLAISYEGLTVNLAYSPAKYTPEFESSLNTDEVSRAQFLPSLLSELLTDWDLMDEAGQKAPITPITLSGLGYSFLGKLAIELIKDLSPGRRDGSQLRQVLDGGVGEPPNWYRLIRAARYLGVSPWDLAKQPIAWREWALISEYEENHAQIEANKRAMAQAERRSRHESYAPVVILPRIAG